MTLLASLPMYAAPEGAREAFWEAVRRRLAARGVEGAPAALVEPDDLPAHWRSPDLLFSQTCGLPVSTALRDEVVLLGVPHYAAAGCDGPHYQSVFIVRKGDPAVRLADLPGRRSAINGRESHSGFSQLTATLAPVAAGRPVAEDAVVSGGHLRSLALVREGGADFAAIDCVTWALAVRDLPAAVAGLRVVGRSPPSLGLPFIASARLPAPIVASVREALEEAIRDPDLATTREALLLDGLSTVAPQAYEDHGRQAQSAAADRAA